MKVLITGASRGIGLEATKLFLENNYEVIAVARNFENYNLDTETYEFDLFETEKISELVKKIGDIDILINNAGIMIVPEGENYPDAEKEKTLKINLESPVKLIEEFSKRMSGKDGGRIVNVASIAGEIGHPDIWYGITKAGIINATKSFAKKLGSKGIVINAVAPGPVETDMLEFNIPKTRQEELKKNSILKRVANPKEVAKTIYWLAVESPEYINGVTIDINNGAFMR
jgi:3-oxoacyl-[acyl-carrier protein] reductase